MASVIASERLSPWVRAISSMALFHKRKRVTRRRDNFRLGC
jgi:hypothetical protein